MYISSATISIWVVLTVISQLTYLTITVIFYWNRTHKDHFLTIQTPVLNSCVVDVNVLVMSTQLPCLQLFCYKQYFLHNFQVSFQSIIIPNFIFLALLAHQISLLNWKLNESFAQVSCYCCTFYTEITLTKVAQFEKIYYETQLQDSTLGCASLAPNLEVWISVMLLLLTAGY
jgi:hypothetical protein